jgi:hypothetical protein
MHMTSRIVRNLSAVTVATGLVTAGLVGQAGVASAATRISVSANHHSYAYGAKAYVHGHVSTGRATVTITIKPTGHAQQVIHVQAGAKGAFSAHGPVYYDTTITASYHSARDSVRVGTHVKIATSLSGSYRTSDGYRLVHAGTRPVFSLGVAPKKTNHHVLVCLQERTGSGWHTIDTRSYRLDSRSLASLSFRGITGHKFRIRAEYKADKSNLGRNSSYLYVRFV